MNVNDWVNIATIGISFLSLAGFGVIMRYFWEDKRTKRLQNTEEAKKRIKKEKQEQTREVFRQEMEPMIKKIEQIEAQTSFTSAGTLTLLRDRMKTALNSCRKQKWASSSDKANWKELYNTYKVMGGNHFKAYVDQWKEEIESLPSEEEYRKSRKTRNIEK